MRRYLPFMLLLGALSISAVAASYSVYGLAKLFGGHFDWVIIMAGVLEGCKLIVATGLHWYHKTWPRLLTIYLTFAVAGLMAITSMGIYGFLSDGYTQTSNADKALSRQIELVDTKKEIWEERKSDDIAEKELLTKSISDLRQGLSNPNQIQYIDKETGEKITTTSSSARRSLERQLSDAIQNRDEISQRIQVATDSIGKYEIQKVEMLNNSDVASELGPLKYIAGVLNKPMDTVVNWLMLLIVFVFDPLAIALVFAANVSFEMMGKKKLDDITEEVEEVLTEEIKQPKVEPEDDKSEVMDILDELDEHIKTQTANRVLNNMSEPVKERKIVKQTPRGEIITEEVPKEPKLTPNQIRSMSHEAIRKYLKKS